MTLQTYPNPEPCLVHMELVRHLQALHPHDGDAVRHKIERAARRLKLASKALKGEALDAFKAENQVQHSLGRAAILYPLVRIQELVREAGYPLPEGLGLEASIALTPPPISTPVADPRTMGAVAQLLTLDFNGRRLTVIDGPSGKCVVARELEEVLGYAEKSLVTQITRDWGELRDGDHYGYMTKAELQKAFAAESRVFLDFGQRNMVLYEHGVNQVAVKTEKELGTRVRDWLTRTVMPALNHTGQYTLREAPVQAQSIQPANPVAQIIGKTIDRWDNWSMEANYRTRMGRGRMQICLQQEVVSTVSARTVCLDGSPKLEFEFKSRKSAEQIVKLARKQFGGLPQIDPGFIERLALQLGLHRDPWMLDRVEMGVTGEMWDTDGIEVMLDHIKHHSAQSSQEPADIPSLDEIYGLGLGT